MGPTEVLERTKLMTKVTHDKEEINIKQIKNLDKLCSSTVCPETNKIEVETVY